MNITGGGKDGSEVIVIMMVMTVVLVVVAMPAMATMISGGIGRAVAKPLQLQIAGVSCS